MRKRVISFLFGNTRVYCVQGSKVNIDEGCMLSDQIEIRTTDNHSIIDKISGKRINFEEDVILHKHVWLETHVMKWVEKEIVLKENTYGTLYLHDR